MHQNSAISCDWRLRLKSRQKVTALGLLERIFQKGPFLRHKRKVGTKIFGGRSCLQRMLRNLPDCNSVFALFCVGLKTPAKFLPNFPQDFPAKTQKEEFLNSVQTRCIVKARLRKSHFFLRSFFDVFRGACSLGIPLEKKPLNYNRITDFYTPLVNPLVFTMPKGL